MADAPTPAQQKPNPFDRSLIEGPIGPAVWKLAWPTMVQNVIAGLQGVVDHILVGNLIGYTANAAIGISWQIFLVVIVFMASLFTGQAVLVARFVGACQPEKVNRTVYQAFLTAVAMYSVMGPLGYLLAPYLLDMINAAPAVKEQALPFLRINFMFSIGMLLFFMLSSALRAAGDARTPLRLGVSMTLLNLVLNLILVPKYGTTGSAMGTVIASSTVSFVALYLLFKGRLRRQVLPAHGLPARLDGDSVTFPLRAADRRPGHCHEPCRRHAAALHRRRWSRAPRPRPRMPSATPSCFR